MLISPFQALHCVRKNAISPKLFNGFSKTFLELKDVENRYLGRKFHERSYFSLQWQGENFFRGKNLEISRFQTVHCVIKNAISPKVFNRFSKTFPLLKDVENRYWEENFMSAAILVLQLQAENFFQVEKFEVSHFQAVHCVRKNAISPKLFNRFQKNFPCC